MEAISLGSQAKKYGGVPFTRLGEDLDNACSIPYSTKLGAIRRLMVKFIGLNHVHKLDDLLLSSSNKHFRARWLDNAPWLPCKLT